MDVGIQTVFSSHGWDGIADSQVYDEETHLALLAEELGFDEVWLSEHHFARDAWNPSQFLVLAALAQRTQLIRLGTMSRCCRCTTRSGLPRTPPP